MYVVFHIYVEILQEFDLINAKKSNLHNWFNGVYAIWLPTAIRLLVQIPITIQAQAEDTQDRQSLGNRLASLDGPRYAASTKNRARKQRQLNSVGSIALLKVVRVKIDGADKEAGGNRWYGAGTSKNTSMPWILGWGGQSLRVSDDTAERD